MKISSKKIRQGTQIILDCSLCVGAYLLWINALSFVTVTYLLLCCIISFIMNYRSFGLNKITIIWILYVISLFPNVMLSHDMSRSMSFARLLIGMIAVVIIFSNADNNSEIPVKFIFILSFILSLSVIWEFVDYTSFQMVAKELFSLDLYIEISSLKGSFNRYVGFGVYSGPSACMIIFGLCSAMAYMKKNITFYIIICIEIIAILLTGSRSLLILFVIIWMVYNAYMKTKEEKILTLKKIILYLVVIISTIFLLYNVILENSDSLRLFDGSATTSSISARFALYAYALVLFAQNPILGTGINTYLYYSTRNSALDSTYTHNLILQSLAEQGIIGAFLLILAITITFIYIFEKWKHNKSSTVLKFSILIQIVFLVYSMVGNPFYDINLRLIYFLAIMFGLRECKMQRMKALKRKVVENE